MAPPIPALMGRKPAKPMTWRQGWRQMGAPLAAAAGPCGRPRRQAEPFLLVGLFVPLAAAEGRAQDVAERGASIGRAVFGHRLFLFVELLRLDRERRLAGGAIESGDLGIDLLADGETVRPLLGAVARQLRFADESGEAAGHLDLDAAIVAAGDRAGHDIALLDLGAAAL